MGGEDHPTIPPSKGEATGVGLTLQSAGLNASLDFPLTSMVVGEIMGVINVGLETGNMLDDLAQLVWQGTQVPPPTMQAAASCGGRGKKDGCWLQGKALPWC